jgi:hypothetical protein
MSDRTLTQILSKIKHGTVIRHVEKFDNFTVSSYNNKEMYWVHVGHKSRLYLDKEEFDLLRPFVCYCIYFKTKGKSGFYHCEENGLFDMSIQFNTLSQFAMSNIKRVYPKFRTILDCMNHLEYYCKTTNQWIKISNSPN